MAWLRTALRMGIGFTRSKPATATISADDSQIVAIFGM
jgi:hypothetical protein